MAVQFHISWTISTKFLDHQLATMSTKRLRFMKLKQQQQQQMR